MENMEWEKSRKWSGISSRKSVVASTENAAVVTMSDTLWTGARNIRIWTSAGEWRQSLETHAGRVTSMAVAGERVWVAFSDGRLRLFQDETAVCLVQLQNDGKHSAVTCLTPTSHCMWTGTADGHVCCFALESQRQLLMAPVSNHAVASLAATPGSIWVSCWNRSKCIPGPSMPISGRVDWHRKTRWHCSWKLGSDC